MPWWWRDFYELLSVVYMLIMILHYCVVYRDRFVAAMHLRAKQQRQD